MTGGRLARFATGLKAHATVALIAFCVAMVVYGFIHLLVYAIHGALKHFM